MISNFVFLLIFLDFNFFNISSTVSALVKLYFSFRYILMISSSFSIDSGLNRFLLVLFSALIASLDSLSMFDFFPLFFNGHMVVDGFCII